MTEWSDLVAVATSFESWQKIVQHMFDDGQVNQGRLIILHRYTLDVIDQLIKKELSSSPTGKETESEKIARRYFGNILNIGNVGYSG